MLVGAPERRRPRRGGDDGRARVRLFGKRDVCWIPDPQLTERFVDQGLYS